VRHLPHDGPMTDNEDLTRRFIPPRTDLLFRWIFGDQNSTTLVTDLLRAVLPDLPTADWTQVRLVDPQMPADRDQGKTTVLDVKVTTATGKTIDIEIQLLATPGIRERIAFYTADLLVDSINRGQDYTDLRQVVTVVISGTTLVPEEPGYYHTVDLRTANHHLFTDVLSIRILEMPRVPPTDDGTDAWNWMRFLAASTEEEMDMAATDNPAIADAADQVRHYNADATTRHQLLAREKFLRDQLTRERVARREGIEQGLEQGVAQAQHTNALRALRLGLPVDQVAAITGLTPAEITELAPET